MNKFEVGDLVFEAVRFKVPRPHWRLKLPSGEVLGPGSAGISGESRPKMKEDLEYLLKRFGKERFFKEFGE